MSPSPTSGRRVRRAAAVALTVALASGLVGGLAACGNEQPAPLPRETAANGTVLNQADAAFARDLLVQRAREFALIDLTVARPLDADLTAFLEEARTLRAAEIDQATTWLTDWGREIPATIRDPAAAHAGVHHFEEIEKASDAEFADAWIAAYRRELKVSDTIAAAEVARGAFADARALAADARAADDREAAQLKAIVG
jgi:hypothetical protein